MVEADAGWCADNEFVAFYRELEGKGDETDVVRVFEFQVCSALSPLSLYLILSASFSTSLSSL